MTSVTNFSTTVFISWFGIVLHLSDSVVGIDPMVLSAIFPIDSQGSGFLMVLQL